MLAAGQQLLDHARAVRAAYPDAAAMQALAVTPLPTGTGWPDLRAAMRYLWQELALVQAGGSGGVGVLDDEIANVERLLSAL